MENNKINLLKALKALECLEKMHLIFYKIMKWHSIYYLNVMSSSPKKI